MVFRVELPDRPQQLLDQDVVDLGGFLAFEGQVKLPADLQVRILVDAAPLDKNILMNFAVSLLTAP